MRTKSSTTTLLFALLQLIATSLVCALLAACGGGHDRTPTANGVLGPSSLPPAPATATPPCVLNADCPAGEYCDLEQCAQECSTQQACSAGLTCSPRGQCLAAGQSAEAPPPATQYAGSVVASPMSVQLTDRNTSLDIKLTSDSKQPVPYRVELDGPHLGIANTRGQFTGSTTLHVLVSTAGLQGDVVPGTVKIFTSLGDLAISAPIHVGMTGSYSGALRYTAGALSLGDTRMLLDVIQDLSGEISVRVNSTSSLLFPATGTTGDVTGHGQYSPDSGLNFTVLQVVDPSFGGDRNHFGRSIGRSVQFQLMPDATGNLSGTFTETITSLFAEPVTVSGTASLQYKPSTADPNFSVAAAPTLPAWPGTLTPLSPSNVFGWTDSTTCAGVLTEMGPANTADATYGAPLQTAFAQHGDSAIQDWVPLCTAAQQIFSQAEWQSAGTAAAPNNQSCGLVVPLACALTSYAQGPSSSTVNAAAAIQLVHDMLAPGLLIAQNDNVTALTSSFTEGTSAQLDQYDDAMTTLAAPATWVLQPVVLEYLRNIPAQAAEGSITNGSASFPAARSLATLFYVSDVIDGERSRIDAAAASGSQPQLAAEAQQRAVIGFLEAMALLGITEQWGTVPSSVTAHISGMLTPLDNGFAALAQGANAFGVAPSFVPFVFNAANAGSAGASNFEQMRTIALNSVSAESNLETQFLNDNRTYEQDETQLQQELASVRSQYDGQIETICGANFDPSSVTEPSDWQNCGANEQGSVGALGVAVLQAQAKVQADLCAAKGQKEKIQIDVSALAQTQQLDQQNIQFISSTGDALSELDFISGMLSAAEQAIQVAAQASVLNFGAPLGEAAPAFVIGAMQASLASQKQQLETAQTMAAAEVSAETAYVNGMAAIQKETIDLQEMGIAVVQDQIAVVYQQVQEENLVQQAKQLFTERQQVVDAIESPTDYLDDPSYRLMTDSDGLQVIGARAQAQQQLFEAGAALQYEVNASFDVSGAVLNASNATGLTALASCLENIFNESRIAYGTPQTYTTTVSVRQMLGITGPRTDSVTGASLSEGDQFREILLRNANVDASGGVSITFSTDLQPGNGLWASDVCEDRLADVAVQLVGDFLGDNEAQANLSLTGNAEVRGCDSPTDIVTWSLGTSGGTTATYAVIQAGVNTFGETAPNTSFFGQSVARASWTITIPSGAEAPSNADVDLTNLDDIVLKFDHQALPLQETPGSIDTSCLAQIGGGQ